MRALQMSLHPTGSTPNATASERHCHCNTDVTASDRQHSVCHCIRAALPLQYRCGTPWYHCTRDAATAAEANTSTSTAHQTSHRSFRATASTRPQEKLGCRLELGRPPGRLAHGQPGIWLALGQCGGRDCTGESRNGAKLCKTMGYRRRDLLYPHIDNNDEYGM